MNVLPCGVFNRSLRRRGIRMKKTLLCILVFIFLGMTLSSCDKKNNEPDDDSTSNIKTSSYKTTDDGVIIENMYTQVFPVPDPGYQYQYSSSQVYLDGKVYLLASADKNGVYHYQIDCCDLKMNRLGSVPLGELPDGSKRLVAADGALFVAVVHGHAADTELYRVTEDSAVEIGALYELFGWTGHTPTDVWACCCVVSDGEIIYVCDTERLMAVYPDGRPYLELSVSDIEFEDRLSSDFPLIAVNAKGEVILRGKDDKYWRLNAAEERLEALPDFPFPDNVLKTTTIGNTTWDDGKYLGGGYDYYYLNSFGLYGMNEDETSATLLMNLVNSGVTRDTLTIYQIVSPELIFCTLRDSLYADSRDGVTTSLAALIRAEDGLEQREIVTLATCFDISRGLAAAISAFNAENERYRVVVSDYSQYGYLREATHVGAEKLLLDIATGKEFDLCLTDSRASSTYTLKRQGYYADLNQYIDADPDISREDILQCVRDWCTYQGELVYIVPNFSVETVAVRGGTADDGWTVGDLAALNQAIESDGRVFAKIGGESLFYNLMYSTVNDFIDWDRYTCSFDSERFLGLLELCHALPKKSSVNIDDFISLLSYSQELCEVLRSGSAQALVMASGNCRLIQNPAFLMHLKYYFGDYRLIGYPSESGGVSTLYSRGYLGISKKAACGEGAWEFIKFVLSDRYQISELNSFNNFPVTVSALDYVFETFNRYEYWFSQSTNKVEWKSNPKPDANTSGYDVLRFTEEDAATLKAFLNGGGFRDDYNKDLYNIIREETLPFFAGKVSAEQAAKYIQSRASIYLSEHE